MHHFVWDVGREIGSIGFITLRWYGLLFATGFVVGFYIMRDMYVKEGKPVADLDSLLIYRLLGTVAGARLGHILFYDPAWYFSHPAEIIKVWHGGLASHGGAIGILIALYLYSKKHADQPYLWLLDRIVIPTALAGSFIRLGNFFNSEIIGVPSDVPWTVVFKRAMIEGNMLPRHPAQMYESLSYLLIFVLLMVLYRKYGASLPRGLTFGAFLTLVFTARFFVEFVKVRQAAFGETLPLSMGQFLSIPAIIVGLYFLIRATRPSSVCPSRT